MLSVGSEIQRVRLLIDELDLPDYIFAERIGLPQSSVSSWFRTAKSIKQKYLRMILKTFPVVNEEWLLNGKGSMFNEKDEAKVNYLNEPAAKMEVKTLNYCVKTMVMDYKDYAKLVDTLNKQETIILEQHRTIDTLINSKKNGGAGAV